MMSIVNTLFHALDRAECRTVEHLAELTGLPRKKVVIAAARLIYRDYATRAERGCFTLTEKGETDRAAGVVITCGPGKLTAPRRWKRKTVRDKIWAALRIRGKASVQDLLELVSTEDHTPSVDNIQTYLRALSQSGHVRELSRREPGTALTSNGYKRFQLMDNTGPEAPRLKADRKKIFDPNTGKTIDLVATR